MSPLLRERLDLSVERENAGVVREHMARYDFAASFVAGKRVLDVGCGTGYGPMMLRKSGATGVVAVDISREAIERAYSRYGGDGVVFVVGDAQDLPLLERFDVIVCFEAIEHITHPEKLLSRVTEILKPGGKFVVSTPERQKGTLGTKPDNPFHVREWNATEFRDLLSKSFKNVSFYGQYELRKLPFPYSRTLQRKILGLLQPQTIAELDRYPVTSAPPPTPALFPCTVAYNVAVCETPRS